MNKYIIVILFLSMVILMADAKIEQHEGFPVNVGSPIKAISAQDIDGDGKLEIIAAPENRRVINVFDYKGILKWERINGIDQTDTARNPIVNDLNDDGYLEIFSYGNPGLMDPTFYIWDFDGIKTNEIPIGKNLIISSPSITNSGMILAGASPGVSYSTPVQASGIHAFNKTGKKLWYLELGNGVNPFASIPIADLDNDGTDEAVILTQSINIADPTDGKAWVIRANGTIKSSKALGTDVRNAAIADINGDGSNEILIISSLKLFIFDRNLNQISSFSINGNYDPPAIGDIDGDGMNEVVLASGKDQKIYIIRNDLLSSFSTTGIITCSLALGDLNWDKKLEIVAGDINGNIYIWDYSGNLIEQLAAARPNDYFYTAKIADLEGDRNREIILGNYNGNIYIYSYPRETNPPITTANTDSNWHNSSVTITLTPIDAESGVAATYYSINGSGQILGNEIILTAEGIFNINYYSVDNAGNVEPTKETIVKIDRTPPFTSDDNNNQWHNTNVVVNLIATDNLSGVNFIHSRSGGIEDVSYSSAKSISFTNEGAQTLEYYSVDNSGNVEPMKSTVIKIDMTSPSITINTPQVKNYLHSDTIILNYGIQEELSGIKESSSTIDNSWQVSNGQEWGMLNLTPGSHEFSIRAEDNAGNSITQSVNFNVIATIDSLEFFTRKGASDDWITNLDLANSLNEMIYQARQKINAGQNKAAKNMLMKFITKVKEQSGNQITLYGADILETEARYVMDSLSLASQYVPSSSPSSGFIGNEAPISRNSIADNPIPKKKIDFSSNPNHDNGTVSQDNNIHEPVGSSGSGFIKATITKYSLNENLSKNEVMDDYVNLSGDPLPVNHPTGRVSHDSNINEPVNNIFDRIIIFLKNIIGWISSWFN